MNAVDVMTQPVISVTPEATIAEVAQQLLQHRISGLPVVDPDGAVIGMVTEGDLLRRIETGTQRRHSHWLEFLIAPGRLAREYTDANARNASSKNGGIPNLWAFDAATLSCLFTTDPQGTSCTRVSTADQPVGNAIKFTVPTVANGQVFVGATGGTAQGYINIYGID